VSKAQQILALLAEGKRTIEIAQTVGCLTAYVRTVRLRAQSPDGMTAGDKTWRAANPEKTKEIERRANRRYYRSHPEFRARQQKKSAAWYRALRKDPLRWAAYLEQRREAYRAKKAQIAERKAERRAIVAAMQEVARAQAET